jgi:hypothetical protein
MPTVGSVHIDQALTNISIGYKNEQYIADSIFKPVPVNKQSDKYYVFGKERFRVIDDRRAPGSESNEVNWRLSLDQYYCEGHALRHAIPDEEMQNADDTFNLEADAVELLTDVILLNKEVDAASKLLNPDNYDSGLVQSLNVKWSDFTNSNPIADIEDAKSAIHRRSGLRANTLIISEPVFNVLKIHPKLIESIKYTQLGVLTKDLMATLFGVDNILVGSALKSTATNPGQADVLNYIWGNSAVLAYIPPTPGKKVASIGYTFMWNKDGQGAVAVRKWYEQGRRATMIEVERWYDQKIVSNVAGFLITDVITP